ncbi:MAG: aldo/keto reductase [Bacteroidales bacterium]|nr:aldo/keto reductase [Bacteroidales bacterium]
MDLNLPPIGLGLYAMHGKVLSSALKTALDAGCTLFDTAWKYGNEREVGAIVPPDAFVCTKISGEQYNGHRYCLFLDRQSVRKSVARAARKLNRIPLDIVLLHSPFPGYRKAFVELLQTRGEGLVKAVGVSGFGIKQLEAVKAHCGAFPDVYMLEIHPYHSAPEVTDFCAQNGIGVLARSPFAHGQILEELGREPVMQQLTAATGKSVPQIVLRWCVQHGWTALPRSADPGHICENLAIFDFELSADDVRAIDALNRDESYGVVIRK